MLPENVEYYSFHFEKAFLKYYALDVNKHPAILKNTIIIHLTLKQGNFLTLT